MTREAVHSLDTDHAIITALCESLPAEAWDAATGCDRWAVRDVIAHMTQLFRQVVDPGALPPNDPSGRTERTNDRHVEAIRDDQPADLLQQYRTLGRQTVTALAGAQDEHTPIDLGDLGTHPLHLVANAFAFDHLVHLRADLTRPHGPFDPALIPEPSVEQLSAALDWMLAALPAMNDRTLGWLQQPIDLQLTGPGARHCQVARTAGDLIVREPDGTFVATITTPTTEFLRWATGRMAWTNCDVRLDGNTDDAKRLCDSIHIY